MLGSRQGVRGRAGWEESAFHALHCADDAVVLRGNATDSGRLSWTP